MRKELNYDPIPEYPEFKHFYRRTERDYGTGYWCYLKDFIIQVKLDENRWGYRNYIYTKNRTANWVIFEFKDPINDIKDVPNLENIIMESLL